MRSRFSEAEAVELTFDIMRNASNKIAVSLGADAARVETEPSGICSISMVRRCSADGRHGGSTVFALVVAASVVGALVGCSGSGGKSGAPAMTRHTETSTFLPPIYPGTTVPPLPSSSVGRLCILGCPVDPGWTRPSR